jgi:hypothetical protein
MTMPQSLHTYSVDTHYNRQMNYGTQCRHSWQCLNLGMQCRRSVQCTQYKNIRAKRAGPECLDQKISDVDRRLFDADPDRHQNRKLGTNPDPDRRQKDADSQPRAGFSPKLGE